MLIQMPYSLPFSVPNDTEGLLKIGKLRMYKSGKLVLRITDEDNNTVDLDVSAGIQNSFYQELVHYDGQQLTSMG
jgi:hypothetical protein